MKKATLALSGGVIAVALAAGWYFLSPLIINKTVDETLPEMMEEKQTEAGEDSGRSPEPVLTGMFADADNFHKGSGTAQLFNLDGEDLLRLEDFDVTNGPDLYVYLSSHENPLTREELMSGEFLEVARLKGNKGNQNYELPDGSAETYKSVVIYCKAFHVMFSTAALN